jgi:hypothetical protein
VTDQTTQPLIPATAVDAAARVLLAQQASPSIGITANWDGITEATRARLRRDATEILTAAREADQRLAAEELMAERAESAWLLGLLSKALKQWDATIQIYGHIEAISPEGKVNHAKYATAIRDAHSEIVSSMRAPRDQAQYDPFADPRTAARAEVEQLTNLTRLLGPARRVLDRCAEDASSEARAEAAVMAQRIVDWIGHSVTDEPARAADLAAEVERLRGLLRDVLYDHEWRLVEHDDANTYQRTVTPAMYESWRREAGLDA